jgi:hypothetical protein
MQSVAELEAAGSSSHPESRLKEEGNEQIRIYRGSNCLAFIIKKYGFVVNDLTSPVTRDAHGLLGQGRLTYT